jgi:hypothetical protein
LSFFTSEVQYLSTILQHNFIRTYSFQLYVVLKVEKNRHILLTCSFLMSARCIPHSSCAQFSNKLIFAIRNHQSIPHFSNPVIF